MRRSTLIGPWQLLVVAFAVASCGFTPTHDIPAKPNYIQAGVKRGDTVIITTRDGTESEMVVKEVRATAIVGEYRTILFNDIESIAVRSWTEPEHPCGGAEPVGCSIPQVVSILVVPYQDQADKFHGACVVHDFCYRHGFATYGTKRETCDANFYEDMLAKCKANGVLSVLDVKDYTLCQAAALQTFEAVRRYGASAYRTTSSTVCEY